MVTFFKNNKPLILQNVAFVNLSTHSRLASQIKNRILLRLGALDPNVSKSSKYFKFERIHLKKINGKLKLIHYFFNEKNKYICLKFYITPI